jgi:MYXO-CTERM domain-containing protein
VRPDLSSGTCPSVAFDGARFVVAWRTPSVPGDEDSFDLHGAEVTPGGDVLRTFPISEEPEHEGAPYLVANANKQVLAAYTRFVPGAPYDARRARARLIETEGGPLPGPDAGPSDPAPDAGGAPVEPPPEEVGGDCGCTVGAAQPAPVAPLLLLGSVLGLWLVRRRSRPLGDSISTTAPSATAAPSSSARPAMLRLDAREPRRAALDAVMPSTRPRRPARPR